MATKTVDICDVCGERGDRDDELPTTPARGFTTVKYSTSGIEPGERREVCSICANAFERMVCEWHDAQQHRPSSR